MSARAHSSGLALVALLVGLVGCSKIDPEIDKTCKHQLSLFGMTESADNYDKKFGECVDAANEGKAKLSPEDYQKVMKCMQAAEKPEDLMACNAEPKAE